MLGEKRDAIHVDWRAEKSKKEYQLVFERATARLDVEKGQEGKKYG
jgi:hypothetical protein